MFRTSTLTSCWTELDVCEKTEMWCFGTLWCPNWRMSSAGLLGLIRIFLFVCLWFIHFLLPLLPLFFQILPSLLASLFIFFLLSHSILVFLHSTPFSPFSPSFFLNVHCFWRQGAALVCLCNDCLPLNKFSQLVSCQLQTAIAAGRDVYRELVFFWTGK